MPSEVGVLELQIRDNAEQAGTGLDNLADALSRVKTAVGKGIGLGTVGTQVSTLAKTVNTAVGTSKVLTQLTALFNAITGFSKIKQINLNADSFEELKNAVSGFTIGNTGSQLKAMQEALGKDWNSTNATASISAIAVVANSLKINDTAMKLGTVTDAMKKFAAAYKALPDKTKKMNDIIKQMSDSIYGDRVKEIAGDVQARVEQIGTRNKSLIPLKLQQFGGLDKKQVDGQAQSEIDGLMQEVKAGFQDVNTIISKATDSVKQFKGEMKTVGDSTGNILSQFGLINQQFLSEGFSERMREGFTLANEAAEIYANRISNIVLPKVQKISSEEMMIGYNAREATNAISRLLGRLNNVANPKGKGYDQVVNLLTGITRSSSSLNNSAEDAGKFFMQNLEYIDEVEKALDRVAEKEHEIQEVTEQSKSLIDMTKIPASGMNNGDFADAAKEFEYLTSALEKSKENLQFWEETYNRIQKEIKYKGATDERNNALGHAQEGYMLSIDEIDRAEQALARFNEYIENYTSDITQATQATQEFTSDIKVFSSIEEAASTLGITVEEARQKLNETYQMVYAFNQTNVGDMQVFGSIEEAAQQLGLTTDEVKQKLSETLQMLQSASSIAPRVNEITTAINEAKDSGNSGDSFIPADKFIETYSHLDYLKNKLVELKNEFDSRRKFGLIDADEIDKSVQQIIRLQDEIKKLEEEQEKASHTASALSNAFTTLKSGIQKMFPTLSGMIKRFSQIAKYRMLRAVLKHITSGFTEGVENVYHYSKIVGTDLAPAMDAAATSFQQLKNSVGAAVAPLIQAFIPVIRQVISVVIEGINYLNQFFALFNGQQTWTRALPEAAEAYDNTAKNAKKASGATKDMLAAWDELNIISSQSGGSAGTIGGHTTDEYKNMFEEVNQFNEDIKRLVDGIEDQFGSIINLAKKVGAILLGWKVSKAFSGVLGTLGSIFALGGIIDLTFNVTTMFDKMYFDTKDEGWVVADILTTALGASLANKVIKNSLGAKAGKYAAAITLGVSAAADIVAVASNPDVSALSTEGIITTIKSALKLGGGMALFGKAAGLPTLSTIKFSVGAALIGVAVSFGINAIAEAAETGEITVDNIKETVASAVAGGLGVTVFAMAAGVATTTALAVGAASALVIGAGILVALAVVASINKDNVTWGTISLTDEEVQNFVNEKLFNINVPVTIDIIEDNLSAVKSNKKDVETKMTNALGTFKVIKLGIADDNDYEQLAKDILGEGLDGSGGLVGAVESYVQSAKDMGKLTLQFTPSLVGTETTDASEWFTTYTTGWDTVNEFVAKKGQEIGHLLTTEEGKKIVEDTPEVLAALMQQVNEVTNAITSAQISSEAFANLTVSIGDLDKASATKVIDAYSEYIKQLTEKEKQLVTQQYTAQAELVAGLIAVGADPTKDPLKTALEKYKYMGEHLNEAIEEGVENASRPGAQTITQFLKERYKNALEGFAGDLDTLGYLSGIMQNAFQLDDMQNLFIQWLKPNNADLARTIEETGIYAWNVFDDTTKARIRAAMELAFGEDTVAKTIEKWEKQTKDKVEETVKDATKTSNATVDVNINPVIEKDELQSKIEEALKSGGSIDWDEQLYLANTYGASEYLDKINKMGLTLNEQGYYVAPPTLTPPATEPAKPVDVNIDGESMKNSVSGGVAGLKESTDSNGDILSDIRKLLRTIAATNTGGRISQSSIGIFNAAAAAAAAKITGEGG